MNLTLTLTANTLAAISKAIACKESLMLQGNTPYMQRAHADACEYALSQLLCSNADTTGYTAMLDKVAAIQADIDGEFARQREFLAIEADLCNDHDKSRKAHLAQTLNAVRLERQFAQQVVA